MIETNFTKNLRKKERSTLLSGFQNNQVRRFLLAGLVHRCPVMCQGLYANHQRFNTIQNLMNFSGHHFEGCFTFYRA
jgi:hypothetical protein